jgi:pteridine reductase
MPTILITGAAKRIGAYLANYLHEHGFDIALHYHQSQQEAQTLCQQLLQKRANSAHLIQADLSHPDGAAILLEQIQKLKIEPQVIIHNASIYNPSDEHWDVFFQLHVKSPYMINLGLFSILQKNQGSIINISDVQALKPLINHCAYVQSKAAMHSQTQCLALEFAPWVRVNEIAPGKVLAPKNYPKHQDKNLLKKIPLQRRGQPIDIAKAVYFLIDCDYITGQTIVIDGGRSLC